MRYRFFSYDIFQLSPQNDAELQLTLSQLDYLVAYKRVNVIFMPL